MTCRTSDDLKHRPKDQYPEDRRPQELTHVFRNILRRAVARSSGYVRVVYDLLRYGTFLGLPDVRSRYRRGERKSDCVATRGAEVDEISGTGQMRLERSKREVEIDFPRVVNQVCDTATNLLRKKIRN